LNFKEICELIQLVADKGIPLVEVEHAGVRVKVQGTLSSHNTAGASLTVPQGTIEVTTMARPHLEAEEPEGLHYITAPMVGTFYRAPKPGADPFVEIGSHVEEGSILCIIEAMKLMNEIECDFKGEIVNVFPKNGESVEFGQKLFAIKSE